MITFKKHGNWTSFSGPHYEALSSGRKTPVAIYGEVGHGRRYTIWVDGVQRADRQTFAQAKDVAARAVASIGYRIVSVRLANGNAAFDIFNANGERVDTVVSFYAAVSAYPAALREWET